MLESLWLFIIPLHHLRQAGNVHFLLVSLNWAKSWVKPSQVTLFSYPLRVSSLTVLLLLSGTVQSNEITDLYESRLAVESQSRDERQDALRNAFEQVLVKVSGHQAVLEKDAVRSELARHTNYLVQYSYATEGRQLLLRAQFDERRIEELLRRADATYWSARRPNVMLWIATDEDRGVQLLGRERNSRLIEALREQAQWRGMPISFPLLDLTDRMLVSPSDVWGRFDVPVLEATKRYPADGVVMLRVQQVDDQRWRGQWTLVVGNTRRNGQSYAADLEALGKDVMNEVTERVAAEYAVTYGEASEGDLTIRVTNLLDLERVLEAETMLGRLGAVERVTLTRYHQGTAEFKLRLLGDVGRALQALELENRMEPVVDPWSGTATPVMEYRWLR
ncbi:hypothetical protein CWE12_00505 [Aliidiomarina sedimenti]|uniref:DUF2066 domain-containing protein n=1 Tax=Aliidiomarina sedimenti TaxID=1933879 RepID=A0ABY0C1I6_9GAMM|nr:hypothetical protein CWE12_00505 [Aliidiomarina sedimenti]